VKSVFKYNRGDFKAGACFEGADLYLLNGFERVNDENLTVYGPFCRYMIHFEDL
jgi:hypothetical protein